MILKKNYCYSFNSYNQAIEIINICKKNKITPNLFCKYYLINGLGIDWLKELICMLQNKFGLEKFTMYVDTKKNYGLFIDLVENNIDFIEVKGDKNILKKLREIGKLNKVLINPNFSIVDLTEIKNIELKIKKILN